MQTVEIDGSIGEGGGQILRTSLTLAAIFQKSIKLTKIRAGRKQPGLRPQHLQAVIATSRIAGGELKGAAVGSTELEFTPRKLPRKFSGVIDTGTAGSVSLIAQTIIPISIFGAVDIEAEIRGGTEVPKSPTIDYVSRVVRPIYDELGGKVDFSIKKRGYYPRGGGVVTLRSAKLGDSKSVELLPRSDTCPTKILSVSRSLPGHVAVRQAQSAKSSIEHRISGVIDTELDSTGDSLSPGSSILVYETGFSKFIGASSLGERGKRAETVGEDAAQIFLDEAGHKSVVDSHLADMLVTLLSCVPGKSRFTTSFLTDHFSTNCIVAQKLTGCEISTRKSGDCFLVEIAGPPENPN